MTDSEQVPWGKDEKHFGKRVKQYVKLLVGKRLKSVASSGTQPCFCEVHFLVWRASVHFDRWKKAVWMWQYLCCVIAFCHIHRSGWILQHAFSGAFAGVMALNDPSWNTDQGVYLTCESLGGKPIGEMKVIVGNLSREAPTPAAEVYGRWWGRACKMGPERWWTMPA